MPKMKKATAKAPRATKQAKQTTTATPAKVRNKQDPSYRDTEKKRCATYLKTAHIQALEREFGNVYQGIREVVTKWVSKQKAQK